MFSKVTPGSDTWIPCDRLGDREAHASHGTSVGLTDSDDITGIITLLLDFSVHKDGPVIPLSTGN